MASEPYRLERGPRTISMRSICSTGMSSKGVVPRVAEPTLTPSISTSTWSDSVPRSSTEVDLPGPPLLTTSRPGTPRSRSWTDCAWRRSISWRVITVTEASVWSAVSAVRLAVTTTGSSSTAGTEWAPSSSQAAAGRCSFFIFFLLRHAHRVRIDDTGQDGGETPDRHAHASTGATSPSAMPTQGSRPVSGLARGPRTGADRLPAPQRSGSMTRPQLAYRCGGSAGLVPRPRSGTHRLPVSPLARRGT